jgi:hypothetical protein
MEIKVKLPDHGATQQLHVFAPSPPRVSAERVPKHGVASAQKLVFVSPQHGE